MKNTSRFSGLLSARVMLPLCLCAAAELLTGCGKTAEAKSDAGAKPVAAPVTIRVMPVKVAELQRSVRIVGSLVGLETATISNRVTGVVSKIYVDRGDYVKPGQPLLEIEPERYDLAEHEAEATLQQTLARLGLKDVPGQEFDVNQTAPVKKAQSDFENAKNKYDRSVPLHDSHTMNDFEWLDIVSAYKSAESSLEASRDEARALVAEARQNNAQIAMRSKDSRDSVIMAPDGTTPNKLSTIDRYVVSDRRVSVGEYLREGTDLFTLMADGVLKLQAHVPERFLGDVKKGARVQFTVEAYHGEVFDGTVATIDPAVDPASRTFLIEALVDNKKYDNRLRPGSFVPGDVLTKKEGGRVMVPLEAVTSFVGVTKVYKLNGDKAVACDVTTDQQETYMDESGRPTQWLEISKGNIAAGDTVAVSGISKLVNGSTVVIDTSKPVAAAASVETSSPTAETPAGSASRP